LSCAWAQNAPVPQQVPAPPTVDLDPYKVADKASAGVFYWLSSGHVDLGPGIKAANPDAQRLRLPDASHDGKGFFLSTPAGKYNSIEIEAFQVQGSGLVYAPRALSLFGTSFTGGDPLGTSFRLRGGKVQWNYLTYPSPPEKALFRVKTLWGVHILQIQGVADDLITSVPTTAIGTKLLIMPTVGIGLDIAPSKFFHIEMQAAGMALSGRSRVLDGEAKAVFRVKKLEVLAGAKGLDFRTTLKTDQYFRSRLTGPFAGVRWVF